MALAAQMFERRGELARARDLARQRYDLAVEIEGSDASETDRARGQLGFVLARMGEREGIEWCEAAVAGLEHRLGARHHWSIAARVDLGGALQASSEHGRAIAVLRDALVIADASDIRSLRSLAGAINSLALARFQSGDEEEADALLARAIELVERRLPSDRALLLLYENHARVQISLGHHADAAASIARAMDLAISRGEADTASYATALEIAGMLDLRRNEAGRAVARFEAALAIRRALADAARTHRTEVFLARALADLGRWRDAERLARPAMQALAELGAPALGDGHALLGDIAREHGDDNAVVHYRAAIAAWKVEPADADVIAATQRSLAEVSAPDISKARPADLRR
jgi:tetratricopeptide (TPR) repeat protein